MNKLGLASLDGLELSDAATTAGFWKPPEMLIATRTYRPTVYMYTGLATACRICVRVDECAGKIDCCECITDNRQHFKIKLDFLS